MNLRKYNIKYDKSILNWDEALPIGNGMLGCLIYGDGLMKLSFDRADLWDLRPNPTTFEEGFCYKNLLKLVRDGSDESWKELRRLFNNIFGATAYPSKIAAGRVELDFGVKTEVISSEVDLKTATATVEVGDYCKIEAFFSAKRPVAIFRIYGEYSISLRIPEYISAPEGKGSFGYSKAEIINDGEFTYYDQATHTDFRYGTVLLEKKKDGYSELFVTVATNKDGGDYISDARCILEDVAKVGYDVLHKEHVNWWRHYWARSSISVGDELLESVYYRSYYLFASCSRKGCYPMALQGVWTADNDKLPPWKGDYHHDTNTELSYQSYLKANRLDEGRVFVDYLWSLKGEFESFAKKFFGVKGLLLPSCSTLDGKAMGGWAQYSLSPTMTIWAAQSFDEYYLYTGDEGFLRTRAYPFLKEVGDAIFGLLEEKDGKLYLPLSTSPEIFDDTRDAYLNPNSNFDLALMRYLYGKLVDYSDKLGKNGEKYKEILSKLDDIAVSDKGVILLDPKQELPKTHRHFSHLMCLYPLHLINYDTEEHKRIYDNTILNIERLGSGRWIGFSFAMCAQIYAMAYRGNAAYEKLYQFANGFVGENGFHLNGDFKNYGYSWFHYRPFTLESSFGFCDALQEMLMQEHRGYIHLFPSIPERWRGKDISFNDLRSYGGLLVSAKQVEGKVTEVILRAPREMEIVLRSPFDTGFKIENGEISNVEDGMISISLKRGKAVLKAEK